MYPLHDNDLDRLSREAAEHFEVESGASGWAHLEKRLDQELPQKKKRRRFLFWLFFITAGTGGALAGILSYQPHSPLAKNVPGIVVSPTGSTLADEATNNINNNNNTNNTNTNTVAGNNTTGSNKTTPEQPKTTTENPVKNKQLPAASVNNLNTGAGGNNQPAAPAEVLTTTPDKNIPQSGARAGNPKKLTTTAQHPNNNNNIDKTPLSLNHATIIPGNNQQKGTKGRIVKPAKQQSGKQPQTTAGQHNQSPLPVADNGTAPGNNITTNDQNGNKETVDANNDLTANKPITTTQADSTKTNKTVAPAAPDSTQTLAQQKKEDRKKDKVKQPLEIGLMAGPDMSTVAFGPLYKTGYNFGLQMGYRFSNRWSVNAGVIYTKKFYKADSSHFEYKNPWGIKPERMEGNCSMWEIPVNVRYDVSFNDKRRWFISTGLSTYLMDKEDYLLEYGWATPYTYSSDTNKNYLFSIWNLSAGMERSLGKHFSIQAEPYLKVPLRDLGTGKIRMDSYGILFTLKYKPVFGKKKTGKQ